MRWRRITRNSCSRNSSENKIAVVTSGLRKLVVTCKESSTSCATLAGSGVISRLLNGFKSVLVSKESRYQGNNIVPLEYFCEIVSKNFRVRYELLSKATVATVACKDNIRLDSMTFNVNDI